MTTKTAKKRRLVADILTVELTRSDLNFLVPLLRDVYYEFGYNDKEVQPDRRCLQLHSITAKLDQARKR